MRFATAIRAAVAALILVATAACGHGSKYVVSGTIEGKPSMNLRVISYCDGAVATGVTVCREGEFVFEGNAPSPALVEIYDNDYRLLGRLVAENGDDVSVSLKRKSPVLTAIKGNEISERWSRFNADNQEADSAAYAAAIARYVSAHRDDPLSAILVAACYTSADNPAATDSLLSMIDAKVIPAGIVAPLTAALSRLSQPSVREPIKPFTMVLPGNGRKRFNPAEAPVTIIALSDSHHGRDSVKTLLRSLDAQRTARRVAVVDLWLDADTLMWNRAFRTDTIPWQQGWVPGSVAGSAMAPLGIPTLPYFIVTDTAGRQLWRGTSARLARSAVITRLPSASR